MMAGNLKFKPRLRKLAKRDGGMLGMQMETCALALFPGIDDVSYYGRGFIIMGGMGQKIFFLYN